MPTPAASPPPSPGTDKALDAALLSALGDDAPTLTPADVAALLGIEMATVGVWRRRGKLSGVKIGARSVRYRLSEIRRLLEGDAA